MYEPLHLLNKVVRNKMYKEKMTTLQEYIVEQEYVTFFCSHDPRVLYVRYVLTF
jgi:hypothetical protein